MTGSERGAWSSAEAAAMIERLDPAIFRIESETSANDRISLLRLQRLVRRQGPYCYLETGSHVGGSLLPHLADPCCAWAISIDARPASTPDERGRTFDHYRGNSTARMIAALRPLLAPGDLDKLQTFDSDAAAVPHGQVTRRVRLALVDGEHTNVAAFSDFMSVFPLLEQDAVISFHDANLVSSAILNIERFLSYAGVPFRSVFLLDRVGAIGLREAGAALIEEVGSAALPREEFLAAAHKWVWTNRAAEMLLSGELRLAEVTEIASSRFKGMEARVAAIESHPLYRASRPVRAVLSRLRRK